MTAKAYPHFLQKLLNADGITARVVNQGVSGDTSGEYLEYVLDAVRSEAIMWERPDVILLQLGTNDVRTDGDFTSTDRFVANMKSLLEYFRGFISRTADPSRIVLALIPPVPDGTPYPFSAESSRRVREEINPAIARLAGEYGLPLVDNYRIFEERPDLLPGVHPTTEGFRRMAGNWYETIRKIIKERK